MNTEPLYQHWAKQIKKAILPDHSETIRSIRFDAELADRIVNIKIEQRMKEYYGKKN